MKTKPFIFLFLICALTIISVVAIEPLKVGATEESKTKVGVERDGGRGGHGDSLIGGFVEWIVKEALLGGLEKERHGGKGRGGRRGRRGRGENEYSWRGGEREGDWEGGVHEGGLERGENEEPGWG